MSNRRTIIILSAMVLVGAMRNVAVKVFYQMGFETPFFIAILFQISGLPALAIPWVQRHKKTQQSEQIMSGENEIQNCCIESMTFDHEAKQCLHACSDNTSHRIENGSDTIDRLSSHNRNERPTCYSTDSRSQTSQHEVVLNHSVNREEMRCYQSKGSQTGLTADSHFRAISILHLVHPTWVILVILGSLNLITYVLRWSALLYLEASVAEMVMNGFLLVFTAIASAFIRKRKLSSQRRIGVVLVAAGLVFVGCTQFFGNRDTVEGERDSNATYFVAIGLVLALGACIIEAFMTITEEILIQEGGYSVMKVMGYESVWGLLLGFVLYIPVAPLLGENPSETWELYRHSTGKIVFSVALTFLFTIGGFVNLFALAVTSAMTRNMWQHLKCIPVWIIGLAICYSSTRSENKKDLGECWRTPSSLFALFGMFTILGGVYVYYRRQRNPTICPSSAPNATDQR